MTRKLYDSTNPADIPLSAEMVGGYISGSYKWSDAGWARFPNAVHVTIATSANVNDGVVLDVEKGDATPAEAPSWVVMRRRAGVEPTVYCSASQWQNVKNAFHYQGIPEPYYWIAQWDNKAELLPGAVAKQYSDPPASGGHYDLSIVADHWPGVDQGEDMPLNDSDKAYIQTVVREAVMAILSGGVFGGDVDPTAYTNTVHTYNVKAVLAATSAGVDPNVVTQAVKTALKQGTGQ